MSSLGIYILFEIFIKYIPPLLFEFSKISLITFNFNMSRSRRTIYEIHVVACVLLRANAESRCTYIYTYARYIQT